MANRRCVAESGRRIILVPVGEEVMQMHQRRSYGRERYKPSFPFSLLYDLIQGALDDLASYVERGVDWTLKAPFLIKLRDRYSKRKQAMRK